jgi:hypothetical protein
MPGTRDVGLTSSKSATATTHPTTATGLAVNDEVEQEEDSTWVLSDQEHDGDGVASDDAGSISSDESYVSEDLPEEF